MHRFEVYKDEKGEFRFRFRASNGEAIFASEGYASKSSAMTAIASIKDHVGGAEITDLSAAAKALKVSADAAKAKSAAARSRQAEAG